MLPKSKPLTSILFLGLLFVFLSLFLSTVDLRYHFSSLPLPIYVSSCSRSPPLRVYMYDLDRRFNFAMLDRLAGGRLPGRSQAALAVPPWPRSSGIRLQHSTEYWMTVSLMYDGDGEMEAVRVSDPAAAEMFFVPFFSSLSFNTNGRNMTDPETEVDRQLQIDLLEFLRNSKYYQRLGGRDHVIPMHHPNAFRFYRDQVNTSVLVVADFGRCPKNVSSLRKDVVTPYVHVVDSYLDDDSPNPFESRTTLLFFRGGTHRKDEGIVRVKLANILKGQEDVHFGESSATREGIRESSRGMRLSKFCLHPAGDTPSSCRLFDAIVSHCVPVIVSDQIELPFEDEIDYRDFALFFSVEDALKPGYLLGQLRQIPKERWLVMWKALKKVSHHFEFQYPPKKDDAVNMLWRQVRNKLSAVRLAVHRSGRLKIPDWWGRR